MRRAKARSQRLINHNCFNSINDVLPGTLGAYRSSACFCWSISDRDGGASNGPEQPRARPWRGLAVPCADRPRNRGEIANRHTGLVQLNAHQPADVAGFAHCAGPRRRRTIRSIVRSCRTVTSRRHRGSDRSRNTVCRPRAVQPIPATICSTASARSPNTIRGRPGQSRRSVPVVLRRRLPRIRGCGFRFLRRSRRTKRRSRRRWRARWWGSRRASASGSTTIRSARSAITPAAS